MFKIFSYTFFLIFFLFNSSITHSKPNISVIDEALGFMIGGDGGWKSFAIDYQIENCTVTYSQNFMGSTLIAIYNFDKAYWNSATSEIGEDGIEYFTMNGDMGIQEVYLYSIEGEDISDGLWMFGISPGSSNLIFFPILVDISRFENAMSDLRNECKGIKSKY